MSRRRTLKAPLQCHPVNDIQAPHISYTHVISSVDETHRLAALVSEQQEGNGNSSNYEGKRTDHMFFEQVTQRN